MSVRILNTGESYDTLDEALDVAQEYWLSIDKAETVELRDSEYGAIVASFPAKPVA